jgi:hypothetical protein
MADDGWTLEPTGKGTVKITLIKRDGNRLATEMQADHVGTFVAGLTRAFRDAFHRSGRPLPPEAYEGTIPPLEPDLVGLLHPRRNQWYFQFRMGEARLVIDISDQDRARLGQSLIASAAPEGEAH